MQTHRSVGWTSAGRIKRENIHICKYMYQFTEHQHTHAILMCALRNVLVWSGLCVSEFVCACQVDQTSPSSPLIPPGQQQNSHAYCAHTKWNMADVISRLCGTDVVLLFCVCVFSIGLAIRTHDAHFANACLRRLYYLYVSRQCVVLLLLLCRTILRQGGDPSSPQTAEPNTIMTSTEHNIVLWKVMMATTLVLLMIAR